MPFTQITEHISDNKLIIYQLLVRLFGNTNTRNQWYGSIEENGCGKFADITEAALQYLKAMNVSHVWYTGVIEHATLTDYSAYGIAKSNPQIVKGRAGSPYAISDYYDVAPDLAVSVPNRMQEFEQLVKRTHAAGLKVLIDFVPNHVARQYHSDNKPEGVQDLGQDDDKNLNFSAQNNFYYLGKSEFAVPKGQYLPADLQVKKPYKEQPARATGNDCFSPTPSIEDWYETVKLNYGIDYQKDKEAHFEPMPDTWLKMRDIVLFWCDKGVDGFRCDMAEMVPVAFWQWLTTEIKASYPNTIFIAEVYNPSLYYDYVQHGGFDYLYDKVGLYDLVRVLTCGYGNANDLTECWAKFKDYNNKLLRFMENHDEHRIASQQFAADPFRAQAGMVLTATISSSPVMIYNGQEVGEPAQGDCGFSGDDGRTTIFDYFAMPEWTKLLNNGLFDGADLSIRQKQLHTFYQKLLDVTAHSSAIRSGATVSLQEFNKGASFDYNDTRLYSYIRYTETERLLILANFEQKLLMKPIVKIPLEIWQQMGISANARVRLTALLDNHLQVEATVWHTIDSSEKTAGIPFTAEPYMGYIFKIEVLG